jgi:hypothetical protein
VPAFPPAYSWTGAWLSRGTTIFTACSSTVYSFACFRLYLWGVSVSLCGILNVLDSWIWFLSSPYRNVSAGSAVRIVLQEQRTVNVSTYSCALLLSFSICFRVKDIRLRLYQSTSLNRNHDSRVNAVFTSFNSWHMRRFSFRQNVRGCPSCPVQ